MPVNRLLILLLLFSLAIRAAEPDRRVSELKKAVNDQLYTNHYDSAQRLVLHYLEDKDLSQLQVFYGHLLYGDVLRSSGRPSEAVYKLLGSKRYLADVPDREKYESLIYGKIAECYFDLGDYDNAKKFAEWAIRVYPRPDMRSSGHAIDHMIVGYYSYIKNRHEEAIQNYDLAQKAYVASGEVCDLPLCYMKLAKVYNRMHNDGLMARYIGRAISISDSCGIESYKLMSKRTLFDIYKENHNYREALATMEEINALVAKISNAKEAELMGRLEMEYNTRLMKQENSSLKRMNQKNELILRQQKDALVITAMALLVLSALMFLLLRSYKKQKKAEQELVLVNAGLEQKVAERTLHLEEANKTIRENAELLEFQNTQLVDFCNIISHNLRSPMVNMSMLINFISKSTDKDEQMIMLEKLRIVLSNLNETFDELVESLQIKQDLEVPSEKIDLNELLQKTVSGLEAEIRESGARVESSFEGAPFIYYPPKYLTSIFQNLLSNSLKYRAPGRPPVIRLETEKNGNKVILKVTDNGLGIDMSKYRDKIFKIRKVFHEHPDAKGFGLYITKTQVDTMGGKIWVESSPDQGATFYVEFTNQAI